MTSHNLQIYHASVLELTTNATLLLVLDAMLVDIERSREAKFNDET